MNKLLLFSLFIGNVYCFDITNKIEIIRVYDGDTFFVNIDGWPDIIGKNIGIRVAGIDTPEIRTKNLIEKELGYKAKEIVLYIFKNSSKIELRNCERGKYFRIVADVYIDGINLADILINKNVAYKYDGGKKNPPWSK